MAVDGDAVADGGTLTLIRIDGGPVAGPSAAVGGVLWHEPMDVADLDGDGVPELVSGVRTPFVYRLSETEPPSVAAVLEGTNNGIQGLAATRIGADARPDLVLADVGGGGQIHAYAQQAGLAFSEPFNVAQSTWGDSFQKLLRSADLTGDGRPVPVEALSTADGGLELRVWSFAASPPTFTAYAVPGGQVARDLYVRDFDGDGHVDVAVWWQSGFAVLRGDGAGALGPPAVHPGVDVAALGIGDLNGDCLPDVIRFDDNLLVWTPGLPDGGFGDDSPDLGLQCPEQPVGELYVVDLNGDGKPDLLSAGDDELLYGFQP